MINNGTKTDPYSELLFIPSALFVSNNNVKFSIYQRFIKYGISNNCLQSSIFEIFNSKLPLRTVS